MGKQRPDLTLTHPAVPESLDKRVADAVDKHVRIPARRFSFADRLRILLEEYEARGQTLEAQRERLESLTDQLEETGQLTEAPSDRQGDEQAPS